MRASVVNQGIKPVKIMGLNFDETGESCEPTKMGGKVEPSEPEI